MDDIVVKPRVRISPAEVERRRRIVRQADAHNRIEGVFREPETDAIFDAFVRGDIEATDIVPRLKAQLVHH